MALLQRRLMRLLRSGHRHSETLLLLVLAAVCLVMLVTYVRGRPKRPLTAEEFKQLMDER
jgi:hypothetical protein